MQVVFLIPYYNHPYTIGKLTQILQGYAYDILIVDDGSNEDGKSALKALNASNLNLQMQKAKLMLYTKESNEGKGSAIKKGLGLAYLLGYSHAFCVDADLQHDLSNFDEFMRSCEQNPEAIICANPIYSDNAPKSRLYGRKITNFWVQINTLGGDIKDCMCGMRIYPLKNMQEIYPKCKSDAMDFDIEIFVMAYKFGIKFVWIDTKVSYEENGISHFKYLKDNLKISKVHAKHFFLLPLFAFKKLRQKL
ncbi:MAG: glycosyltransferase family 2 protein [Campylobacter sp.]|nr:glycosyltransferase family 2 protein [Campylobacter sp.]